MQQLRWRAVAVVAVLVATGGLMATRSARLGLDLRGGTQIALEAKDTGRQQIDGDTMNRTLEVLRRRVDQLGVAEPTLQRSGDRRIIVELPGLKEPDTRPSPSSVRPPSSPSIPFWASKRTPRRRPPRPPRPAATTCWCSPTKTATASASDPPH